MGLWVGHLAGDQGTGFNPNPLSFCPLSVFLATLCAVYLDGDVFEGRDMPFHSVFVDFLGVWFYGMAGAGSPLRRGGVCVCVSHLPWASTASPRVHQPIRLLLGWEAGGQRERRRFLLGWQVQLSSGQAPEAARGASGGSSS